MTSYNYSISTYYDFGCTSSPIIMMSSKSGCISSLSCTPSLIGPYAASATSCSKEPIVIPDPTRDYVVKSLFPYSDSCQGLPLTQYAVAADYSCHSNPHAGNNANIAYFRVSCNGAEPIWDECLDSACNNCTSTAASSSCLIAGAGASNGFYCIKAPALTSSAIASATLPLSSPTVTHDDFVSSASRVYNIYLVVFIFVVVISTFSS